MNRNTKNRPQGIPKEMDAFGLSDYLPMPSQKMKLRPKAKARPFSRRD